MHGQMEQRMALLLLTGSVPVYVAFEHPSFGTTLLVGVGVVTLLHPLLKDR